MHKTSSIIAAVLAFISAFLLYERLFPAKESYPLENEVQSITKEFYLHFLAHGSYPTSKDFLSKKSQNIIRAYPKNFKWSESGMYLDFTPSKEFKMGNFKVTGFRIGEPGETFEHNAKLYKDAAAWADNSQKESLLESNS